MKIKFYLLSIFLISFCAQSEAQELPPIITYLPSQYGAENQNWSISQGLNNFIYVANNKGLLEFNGANWHLYPSPNASVIRSVRAVNGLIYTGSYMDFGYWEKNDFGSLDYTSLTEKLKIPLIDDEQFWNILALNDYILFQSLNRIYIYNIKDETYKVIDSHQSITKMFKVDDTVYYQSLEEGISKIEGGQSQLIIDDPIFQKNNVINIFNQDGHLLIQTQEQGFYVWNNSKLSKWITPSTAQIDALSVYNSLQLKTGDFLLGTISNGLIFLNASGEITEKIDQRNGLANNTVLGLFEDANHNIWLALDNGINCINKSSALRIYNDENGDLGTVYSSILFEDKLYLGTNQGLFFKIRGEKGSFKFIEGTKGQVWCLKNIGETLFCGHNLGTFIIEGEQAKLIPQTSGTWDIQTLPHDPELLIQGNYNGLNILERREGFWSFKHKVEGFNISSRYFATTDNNTILVSSEYKGVYKINANADFSKALTVKKDSFVDKGVGSSLLKYQNQILYAYKQGVFIYNVEQENFVRDSLLSSVIDVENYTSGKLISDAQHDKLWAFSDKNIIYVSPGKFSAQPLINRIPIPRLLRKEMVGYETISYLDNDTYLFGTSTGYMIIDLNKIVLPSYKVAITGISNFRLEEEPQPVNLKEKISFDTKQNNIQFSYSVAEYNKYLQAEYQYMLEGYYDVWSPWSSESWVLFKNLPFGNYTFKVRSKVGNNISEAIATYQFQIQKPWYLSNVLLLLYVLVFMISGYVVHIIYKRYYRKQKKKLMLKNKRDLELKEMESEQQLMQLKNEKLLQDIENKNRELAISTMSLIKKNEFLNQIKEELKGTENQKSVKPVIKIIDKNINTTDDWKFFQEAFNNADKDFLKKIKNTHPKLTPNDLKLCAYLRLNLSSKEIAPLLNISPRSVEVKRYRLRKKMDLPHEASLTHYILEL